TAGAWASAHPHAMPAGSSRHRLVASREPRPKPKQPLLLGLGRLAVLARDGDVGHGGAARGAVPVILVGRDQDDVALRDGLLLVVRCDFAGPFGNHQNLVAGVLVELVARAGAEVDDAKVKGLA